MMSRSPRATAGVGGGAGCWSRDGRRGGDPGRSFGPHAAGLGWSDASEGESSPSRSGDGPWIGRRLNVSEKLQLLHNSSSSESGAGTESGRAGAAAVGGRAGRGVCAKRSSKLRVSLYDELGDEDGLWRHPDDKHGGLREDGGTAYRSNVG
ncbi:unnamed protein product [Ectocarpus fasciculatus]